MNIGIVAWKLSNKKYYDSTVECLSSVYLGCNTIIVVCHETSDLECQGLRDRFPMVEIINNPHWGNNLSYAWNYLLERFYVYSDFALILSNDVVVIDGSFSWFNQDRYRSSGIVSARDTCGKPEFIFSAFIEFKWLYDKVGKFDSVNHAIHCGDVDYIKRMKAIGIDIFKDISSSHSVNSDVRFIVNHKRSLSMEEIRKDMTQEEITKYSKG